MFKCLCNEYMAKLRNKTIFSKVPSVKYKTTEAIKGVLKINLKKDKL